MATRSEPFVSIDGAEGVGIHASSPIWGVNIRRASDWRERLFRSVGEGLLKRALSPAQKRLKAFRTKSAEDSGHYNGSRPFLLAKVCLIPPFSP
jgi:hypothetical protein